MNILPQLSEKDWELIDKALQLLRDDCVHSSKGIEKTVGELDFLKSIPHVKATMDDMAKREKKKYKELSDSVTILQAKLIELKRYEKSEKHE